MDDDEVTTTILPPAADPLGEALHLLRLTGTLYCRSELTAPWDIAVPALDGLMALLVVTAGEAVLEVDGEPPRTLRPRGLTLIPHGTPHRVHSGQRGSRATPLFDIPVERVSERYELLRHGGGGALTRVTYCVLRCDHVPARRLVAQLPPVLHVDGWDDDGGWLHSTLQLIAAEATALRPGGETVLTRLADVLVVQAIRGWLDTAPEAHQGWLAALRDEHLGRALAAMHRAPEAPWSVESLAREAAMSRSAFSARFTALLGEPVMQYVTQWRMQLAHTHLQQSPEPLSQVAHRFGYASEAAFSRAFSRTFGVSPGAVRAGAGATGR
ncbi:AraC family transcriptional regulator [Dactylosporangium sp. NPDC050588]|uniref:AraC family transcriptional regulator n=1 Tax=Dactylosporangium sp. NPDC050588 TaxID=3157211 RepID=UPI0033C60CC2